MAKKIIFSQEKTKKLLDLYNEGKSLREIEKIMNHTRKTLARELKRNNIIIRDNSINSRKYSHQHNFFEVIDTEAKAYWLGFMYADGFISKHKHGSYYFGVTLSKSDKSHLIKFKDSLEATNEIKDYVGSGFAKNNMFSRLLICSKKTVNDLIDKGCIENKTMLLKFPTEKQIPKELIHHFVRGYFDGDGTINSYNRNGYTTYTIGFVGQYDFLENIKILLNNKKLKLSTKDNKTFQVNFHGNRQAQRILDFLYKDATIYLDRKYNKYLEFKLRNVVKTKV